MKVKLRDLTAEQWDKWYEDCGDHTLCKKCPFACCGCDTSRSEISWFNHKDMFSDKFFDQEIEINEQLLTDKEKEYLENVLRPYKDKVLYILKGKYKNYEYLIIRVRNTSTFCDSISIPLFEENRYYKNLEVDKQYTLGELELFENE